MWERRLTPHLEYLRALFHLTRRMPTWKTKLLRRSEQTAPSLMMVVGSACLMKDLVKTQVLVRLVRLRLALPNFPIESDSKPGT